MSCFHVALGKHAFKFTSFNRQAAVFVLKGLIYRAPVLGLDNSFRVIRVGEFDIAMLIDELTILALVSLFIVCGT